MVGRLRAVHGIARQIQLPTEEFRQGAFQNGSHQLVSYWMEHRMKKFIAVAITGLLAISLGACGSSSNKTEPSSSEQGQATESSEKKSEVENVADSLKNEGKSVVDSLIGAGESYEDVYGEYSQKIIDATPTLIDEFKAEADGSDGQTDSLAEISNKKVEKLAEIANEGVEKMAKIMYRNGDEYSVYDEWSQKLYQVYMDYGTQITDAYMDYATN